MSTNRARSLIPERNVMAMDTAVAVKAENARLLRKGAPPTPRGTNNQAALVPDGVPEAETAADGDSPVTPAVASPSNVASSSSSFLRPPSRRRHISSPSSSPSTGEPIGPALPRATGSSRPPLPSPAPPTSYEQPQGTSSRQTPPSSSRRVPRQENHGSISAIERLIREALMGHWRDVAQEDIMQLVFANVARIGGNDQSPVQVCAAFDAEADRFRLMMNEALTAADAESISPERNKRIQEDLSLIAQRIQATKELYLNYSTYSTGGNLHSTVSITKHQQILNEQDVLEIHKLVLFVLRRASLLNLRKDGEMLYRETYANGVRVHAWEQFMTVHDFVWFCCCKEAHHEEWMMLLKKDPKHVALPIIHGTDYCDLPLLVTNRYLFAFNNGVLDIENCTFTKHEDLPSHCDAAISYFPLDFDEDHLRADFDWLDIPTPTVDRILDYQIICRPWEIIFAEDRAKLQKRNVQVTSETFHVPGVDALRDRHRDFEGTAEKPDYVREIEEETRLRQDGTYERWLASAGDDLASSDQSQLRPLTERERGLVRLELEAVKRNIFMLFGRLFYPVGLKDDMQIAPFIHGRAGTGKSSLGTLLFQLYPESVSKILPSTCEETFGLEGLKDALLSGCLEVDKRFKLSQTNLQSMICGERVSVAMKNKVAHVLKWKASGFYMGNEFGPWIDHGGSVSRRFAVIFFERFVQHADQSIREKLQQEIGALLAKITRSYLEFVQAPAPGTPVKGTFERLHPYFKWTQQRLQSDLNPIVKFLHSGRFEISRRRYIQLKDFAYMMGYGSLNPKNLDAIRTGIAEQTNPNIRIEYTTRFYGERVQAAEYIVGVGSVDDPKDRIPDADPAFTLPQDGGNDH